MLGLRFDQAALRGAPAILFFLLLASPVSAETIRDSLWVTDSQVISTTVSNNILYATGSFSNVGPATGFAVGVDASTGLARKPYPMVTGVNPEQGGGVLAIAPDGAGGWYLGGKFLSVLGQPRHNLAHIDGTGALTAWAPIANDQISAIAISGSTIYVGGYFTSVAGQTRNHVAAFDATTGAVTSWNPDASGNVLSIALGSGIVYAGGVFGTIGGANRTGLAALNSTTGAATTWDPFSNSGICAVACNGSAVYAASYPSGDVHAWSTAGSGNVNPTFLYQPGAPTFGFTPLALDGTSLYVGGNGISAVDAATGVPLAGWIPRVVNGGVFSLIASAGVVYPGGFFTTVAGVARNGLAALDGITGAVQSWDPHPANIYGGLGVLAIAKSGNTVYTGGTLCSMNALTRNGLAAFDLTTGMATSWDPNVGDEWDPTSQLFRVITAGGNRVYVGGRFDRIGGQSRGNVAAIDIPSGALTDWQPWIYNPATAYYPVGAILADDGVIYIGGTFTEVSGEAHVNLVSVDALSGIPYSWAPSTNGAVLCLAIKHAATYTLFLGGDFTTVNGVSQPYVAALDPSSGSLSGWIPGVNGPVGTIAYTSCGTGCNGTVWLAGGFSFLGANTRHGIGSIDAVTGTATSWDPNCQGGAVGRFLISNRVYVAGSFLSVGGQAREYLASVDSATGAPTSWNPDLPADVGAIFDTMSRNGNTIYVGGSFSSISGAPHTNLVGIAEGGTVTAVEERPVVRVPSNVHADPNPFEASTTIRFALATSAEATIVVYDVAGRVVRHLSQNVLGKGENSLVWNGQNDQGRDVGAGLYFCRVRAGTDNLTTKVFRLKLR